MKLLIISPVIYTFWNYTTYAFIAIILAIVIIDLITSVSEKERASNLQYEGVKEIFNDVCSSNYVEEKTLELKCAPTDFSAWSYRELQAIAKSLNISGRNRKRLVLEQELLAVCK